MVKNLPTMQNTWVQSLGWEDPMGKRMATHSSTVTWRIPMDRGAWQGIVHEAAKSWTRLNYYHTHTHMVKVKLSGCANDFVVYRRLS